MFKIAICDDITSICAEIEDWLIAGRDAFPVAIETEVFYSGEDLLSLLRKQERYDLIILDIEMALLNGIEVGKKIREELGNNHTQIIYISARQDYAMQLFDNRPLTFLIKPLHCDDVLHYTLKAMELFHSGTESFRVPCGGGFRYILYKDILYFASENKRVSVVTLEESIPFYEKLPHVEEALLGTAFLPIHKSYIVNPRHIVSASYSALSMTNGIHVPISQSYRKSVRERLLKRRRI